MSARHVLVVDDEADFCDFVEEVARGLGYHTVKVTDPRDFFTAFDRFRPDTVVLDMVMPEFDGFDIVRWLIDQQQKVRLLIVTGYSPLYAKSAQLQSLARGLDAVKTFTKPRSVSKLRAALI